LGFLLFSRQARQRATQASRLFRITDVDEAISGQNAVTVALAKKYSIIS
jgi:hypothetical protein